MTFSELLAALTELKDNPRVDVNTPMQVDGYSDTPLADGPFNVVRVHVRDNPRCVVIVVED